MNLSMLSASSSVHNRDVGKESSCYGSLQSRIFSSVKFQNPQCPSGPRVLLGFSIQKEETRKGRCCSLSLTSSTNHIRPDVVKFLSLKRNTRRARAIRGFKLQCQSRTNGRPAKISSINGKTKRYGGVLPSILRSLDCSDDLEQTLSLYCQNLSPKEQTVVLKEQGRWQKVVRVFEWFKSREGYVPNVIHYNVLLRALGRARKWNELRLFWIEMAKDGVLPTTNTYAMLIDLFGKAGLVKEALMWMKHMRLRGISPDEVTMNTVLRVLRDAGEYDRADRFYKNWCVGQVDLDDLDLDSVDDCTDESASEPVTLKQFLLTELFRTGRRIPDSKVSTSLNMENSVKKPRFTSTYNTLIDLYGKAGRLKDAAKVFKDMLKSGVAMDVITFNTMIFTCGSHGLLSEAEALLAKMEERGIAPDTKTYNIFLSLYADAGNFDAAMTCYRKIREVGLFPDVVTHRALLHILCERNAFEDVGNVVREMEKSGVPIDEHSLPGMVKMYINAVMLDQAKLLLEKYQFNERLPAKISAAILDAYAEKGHWAEAESLFSAKRDLAGQKMDVLEYNVMMKAYGKAKLYDKAFLLFKGMRNHGNWPDICTYNSLIQMFAGGDLVEKASDLLVEMNGAGFKPSCQTFSAVIASYVRLGRISDAVDIYDEMICLGVKPNEVVFGALIDGFAESGQVEEALKYFHQMEEHGISANQVVLTSLIKAYSKLGSLEGAKAVFERMKSSNPSVDIIASNSMLNLYAELGMESEAKLLFENLREKGLADEVSYATMMYLYKNMGMLDEAIDIAEEMKESGLLRDCNAFNKVMASYATSGQLRECGELLHEMLTKKLVPDNGTFKVLFTILKKGGIPIEAVTQLESCYWGGKHYAKQALITSVFSVLGMHSSALGSLKAFLKAETALDTSAYNVAIYAYGEVGDTEKALNVFMRMQDKHLEPDLVTYIYLIGCYGKAGMIEGVKRIYGQMECGEIEPSESLFNAIINAYRNANRRDLAEMVIQEMKFTLDPEEDSESDTENLLVEGSISEEDLESEPEDIPDEESPEQ